MRESGLAELLTSLTETVWVGVSAGSMVMTPRIGTCFVEWQSAPNNKTLGRVDFSIFPHLDHPMMPGNTLADAGRWTADIAGFFANGAEDTTSEAILDWVPACENYTFMALPEGTRMVVDLDVTADFEEDMNQAWPKALALLKNLSESSPAA